ncbi:acetylglutamate kinase [Peribacillus kribbensis]|uniref:acetylglutamate kinase n=1 Tax=Peribacillus kribbensis TaxID=356658 RepID=UPI0003F4B002|nr:acetylglutamate kinase [Peribacillus kribbensis]
MEIIVIKCGGSTLNNLSESFFESLIELKQDGRQLVFIHGGGPDINEALKLYDIQPEFKDGLRKTTPDVMEIVELVLAGRTNRKLVEMLGQKGFKALGLNGSDCDILEADYIDEENLGQTGKVTAVNKELLLFLLREGYTPVLTPIAKKGGQKMNVNADMAAGAAAAALGAEICVFITDVEGVMKEGSVLAQLTEQETKTLIEDGTIYGGMKPKVETALSVLEQGAGKAMIASGKISFYQEGRFTGTAFIAESKSVKEAVK